MPAKSGKQYRLMQMALHSKDTKGIGPSKEVAKEFIEKTPEKKRSIFSKKKKKNGK
jgi:hypothetical protein